MNLIHLVVHDYVIDVFMILSPTRLLLTFLCSYNGMAPVAPKMWKKKELETVFDHFGTVSIN